jgi:hypothetical protein
MLASGLVSTDIGLAAFLTSFPFTTKAELIEDQARHPPYGTNLSFPLSEYTRYWQTSGTSTAPIRWLDTQPSLSWMLDCWDYMFAAVGVTGRDRVLAAFSFGPFLGFWTAYESAHRMGCLCFPGGGMGSEARLRMLADNEVSVVLSTPTYALRQSSLSSASGGLPRRRRHRMQAVNPGQTRAGNPRCRPAPGRRLRDPRLSAGQRNDAGDGRGAGGVCGPPPGVGALLQLWMVQVNDVAPWAPVPSLTVTLTVLVCSLLGVPLITPVAELIDRPRGRLVAE